MKATTNIIFATPICKVNVNNNKLIEHTTGINNVATTRLNTSYTKEGVPRNSTLVDNIIKDL